MSGITLEKAIHRLQRYIKYRKPDPDDNFNEAVQLGIEALKRLSKCREDTQCPAAYDLPGETKED